MIVNREITMVTTEIADLTTKVVIIKIEMMVILDKGAMIDKVVKDSKIDTIETVKDKMVDGVITKTEKEAIVMRIVSTVNTILGLTSRKSTLTLTIDNSIAMSLVSS